MPQKTEEQDCRELTTQELEVVAGGFFWGALAAYYMMNREAEYADRMMSSQW
jgi:hypothetical protein